MMKEISMHIMDIVQNSVKANAENIKVVLEENIKENKLFLSIEDDGDGMSVETLKNIKSPFSTSRTTRKVGLGIPMLEQTCLQCGGELKLTSKVGDGTFLEATMEYDNIDRPPIGDIIETLFIIILTVDDKNLTYVHKYNKNEFIFSTQEIKEILGGLSLNTPEILEWLKNYIREGIESLKE